MKKKIVIDLPLNTEHCRAKAMQIAVSSSGVISVNIDKEKGHLVVIGIGVDFFMLMKSLKKKFRCARIVIVEEVKPPDKKPEPCKLSCCCPPLNPPCVPYQYYPTQCAQPVYDPYNPICSIM